MHIPLVYEHLFYKYFVLRSVSQKNFVTYGCCHPCFPLNPNDTLVQEEELKAACLAAGKDWEIEKLR